MSLAIGIDIGGSKIKGVLVDEESRVINSYERPTEADKPARKIITNILEVVTNLRTEHVGNLGVSSPGFELPNGQTTGMPNLKNLEGYNLRRILQSKTGLRVYLDNDANCFTVAEHKKGAAKGCQNVIGVIIGTGVGTGIIIKGELYRGATGGAGECGHTKMLVFDEVKEVEDLISGPNLIKKYENLSGRKALRPDVIFESDDPAARKVYDAFILFTGLFFSNLINTFNPEVIVVGGGISNIPFYHDVQKVVKAYAQPALRNACKIKKNALGDDSGALGAAYLAMKDITI